MSTVRGFAVSTLTSIVLLGATALAGSSGIAGAAPTSCNAPSTGSWSGSAAPAASPYLCAEPGDLVDVRIGDVHATQPSLGYDEVYYKLGRYTLGKDAINKKFDDWCEANGQGAAATATDTSTLRDPASFTCTIALGRETTESIAAMKTVVIGPRGDLYLTDGHHTLTSFYETPDGGADLHVRLRVSGNLSGLSSTAFWAEMDKNKWVWTKDVDGKTVPFQSLPTGVGLKNFADDKYRSLLYFGRDIGYSAGSIPFQEFYWGAWVRDNPSVDMNTWNSNELGSYLDTVKSLTKAQTALPGSTVVDSGFTATDLGVLAAWNDGKSETKGEFAKLSKPYTDEKPGKLAYALAYKATL
ncbi:hypothetical protein ABH922_004227 [Rhodococcus sp. 27YEA15]|uniref:ParB-like protein n=1 Tax=Rhodococcus sp. 27YEA15 TaxID=3156259 RepID=UPI003C7DFDEC